MQSHFSDHRIMVPFGETGLIDEVVVKRHSQEPEELFIYMLDGHHV